MDEDLYPNDSTFWRPTEPKEQVIARKKEQAQALEAKNIIEMALAHFDERIIYRDTISSLNVNLNEDPAMHQKKCEVNDMLKLALQEERNLLEEILVTTKR